MIDIKKNDVGLIKNVRKSKWVNVCFWAIMYTFVFLIASKWFIFEDGIISFDTSMVLLYQHIALLSSIIVGFIFIKSHRLEKYKKILCLVSTIYILMGACFSEARNHVAFLVILSILLGQLADCSLLTYIYEMNNSERLFAIVFAHILVAIVSYAQLKLSRFSVEFWFIIFALSAIATILCFFEKYNPSDEYPVLEEFHKKLYISLILACIGGFVAVCSSMVTIMRTAPIYPDARYFYYLGALLGAIMYFVIYRFSIKPATISLVTGFAFSIVCLLLFLISNNDKNYLLSSCVFGGATFNICMINLYYILCNIIRKYKNNRFFKIAPIVSNFAGIIIVVVATMITLYANETAIKIILAICLIGDALILASSIIWDKGISTTSAQEQYIEVTTALTKEQIYESVGLSEREIEVAELLLEGIPLKVIAEKLFVTYNTVKTHRSAIYRKFEVSSREELERKINRSKD
ncbi:MAG: LuxR C-terminal-related transcriptional regulator [Clostridia bacterium]|nr:LuxR C-terminal-related transcriptional regulator [Clostridia bacterium]